MFCPKCGSILMPKKEGTKKVMACSCGYTDKDGKMTVLKDKVEKKEELAIVDGEDDMKHLPVAEVECPKCKNLKARFWTIQTRASDEPETKFFRCENCRHTWRDYS